MVYLGDRYDRDGLPINKALAQQSGDAERNTLRIMSYNIRNGRGMDEVTDLGRIADAICKVGPRCRRRTGGR